MNESSEEVCTAGWRVSDQLGQYSFLIMMIYDNDDDKDDDDDDEVLGVRCLSAGEHANPQSGEHQSCRPRGGSMH